MHLVFEEGRILECNFQNWYGQAPNTHLDLVADKGIVHYRVDEIRHDVEHHMMVGAGFQSGGAPSGCQFLIQLQRAIIGGLGEPR